MLAACDRGNCAVCLHQGRARLMKGLEEPSPSVPRQELQAQPLPQGQVQPGCRVQSHTGPTMLLDSDIQSLQTQGCSCCRVAGVRPTCTHHQQVVCLAQG